MTANDILHEIKMVLEGRPGQPIVLGVCAAAARRFGFAAWGVRLAVIVAGLVWTVPVLAAYVIAGFALKETERRTRDFFAGLAIVAREWFAKLTSALGRPFEGRGSDSRSRGY